MAKSKTKPLANQKFSFSQMALVAVVFGVVGGLIAWAAFAAARSAGACGINPNPATVNTQYLVTATGMPIDAIYDVFVKNPIGTTSWVNYGPETQDGNAMFYGSQSTSGSWTYYLTSHHVSNSYVLKGQKIYATCTVQVN